MNTFVTRALALISIAGLAACNGTTAATPVDLPSMRTAGTNKPLLEALQTENQGLSRTPLASLPMGGSATYTGYAQIFADGAVIQSASKEVVGVANLEVGFANGGTMTGTLTNFDDAVAIYDGTLNVTGGAIGAGTNGPEVTSDVAGTLTRSTGETFDISGKLTGGFFGATGQYLNGANKINVTSGGQTATTDITLNAAQ